MTEIDCDRILHIICEIKERLAADTKFCAAVKADAYGHGTVTVSKAIEHEADFLVVARVCEGIGLEMQV